MADFDFDVGTGLSGAASGAAIGTQFAPGIGTAIGAGAGFLTGFFGNDEASPVRDRAIEENRERLRSITGRLNEARERSPTDTSFFQVGTTELQEQSERQAERDASQAAARGLTGSQFAVAQDQNRAQTQAEGLRSLLRTAEEVDRQEEARLFQAQQRQRESLNALLGGEAQMQARNQRAQGQALRSVFSNLPAVLNSMPPGGAGGSGGSTRGGGMFTPPRGTVA